MDALDPWGELQTGYLPVPKYSTGTWGRDWSVLKGRSIQYQLFKNEMYLLYTRTQYVPRSKHFFSDPSCYGSTALGDLDLLIAEVSIVDHTHTHHTR